MGIKTCVSLYSLQYEFMHKRMSLEDIFRFLADDGVQGIEILPDQSMHRTPHPSQETLREWDRLVEKYGITPACADVFLNTNLYENRRLTQRECVELLIAEIKLANRLGFKLIRLVSMVPGFVIEPLIPYCEQYDVAIALEIHAGMSFDTPATQDFIEEMRRVGSPYCGLVVDCGIFFRKLPRVMGDYCVALGGNLELVKYVENLFDKGWDGWNIYTPGTHEYKPEFKALIKNGTDHMFAALCNGYENKPVTIMDEYWKYIKHFHFKIFEMVDGEEYSCNTREILQYLHDKGYDGYISTEYEGNRWTLPGKPTVEKEQVLLHQAMLRRYIAEIEGVG